MDSFLDECLKSDEEGVDPEKEQPTIRNDPPTTKMELLEARVTELERIFALQQRSNNDFTLLHAGARRDLRKLEGKDPDSD